MEEKRDSINVRVHLARSRSYRKAVTSRGERGNLGRGPFVDHDWPAIESRFGSIERPLERGRVTRPLERGRVTRLLVTIITFSTNESRISVGCR